VDAVPLALIEAEDAVGPRDNCRAIDENPDRPKAGSLLDRGLDWRAALGEIDFDFLRNAARSKDSVGCDRRSCCIYVQDRNRSAEVS
jgi:hypothetical protein